MTAPPIPMPNVNINPQFVETNKPGGGLAMLLQALQHRQELDIAKQKLQREWEQFELNKKLAGPQLEGMILQNEKKKRDLKAEEDDIAARDRALQRYTGNISRLGDAAGIGQVIADIKDPDEAAHFFQFLKDGIGVSNAATPDYQFREVGGLGGSEIVGFDPQNPTKPVRTGVPGAPQSEAVRRIPVITEREKASYAIGAVRADVIINRLEAQHPNISAEVARVVSESKPLFGGLVHRLLGASREDADLIAEQAVERRLSQRPELLEYYQASKQFLANTIPAIAGKQMTAREYAIQAPSFFSMGASTPDVLRNRRRSRASRIRGFIAEAGEAMPERMGELQDLGDLSAYGIGNLAPPSVDGGTVTPVQPKPKRRAENPY